MIQEKIDFLLKNLDINSSMLSALIGVSESTLLDWGKNCNIHNSKLKRLGAMFFIVEEIVKEGFNGKIILNILNDPFKGETALFDIIVNGDKVTLKAIKAHCKSFKD